MPLPSQKFFFFPLLDPRLRSLNYKAALFTIAKTWKQLKCPLTDEWMKMWNTYTVEYYTEIRRMK